MASEPATFRTFVASFSDFLIVAIHTILYERAIYPQTSFLSARKYNFAVRQNRHPKVCEWINDAVAAVETELLKSAVERVVLMIYTKESQPVERYVFDVSRFPTVSLADLDVPMEQMDEKEETSPVLPVIDMEEHFRATMSKLSTCGAKLKQLPPGCTYTVAIELKGDNQAPVGHPQPWIPTPSSLDHQKVAADAGKGNHAHPVRAFSAGGMVFECWIEETG